MKHSLSVKLFTLHYQLTCIKMERGNHQRAIVQGTNTLFALTMRNQHAEENVN